MYMTLLDEVSERIILETSLIKTEIYLTMPDETRNIGKFIVDFGINEYKALFDIVGIHYIDIAKNGLSYTIDNSGTELYIFELSSGERIMLYALIMSRLNKPLINFGLADRIDKKHRDVLVKFATMFNTLIIIAVEETPMNRDLLKLFYKPFRDIIKEDMFSCEEFIMVRQLMGKQESV